MSLLNSHRRTLLAAVCILCTGIVAVAYWAHFEPLVRLDFSARDFLARYGKKSPLNDNLVFLAVDRATVTLDGAFSDEIEASPALTAMKKSGWPWSRDVYPMIIERLANAGAQVIIFDLLFTTERDGDDAFRATLDRHGDRVVIGANFEGADSENGSSTTLTHPSVSLIPRGDSVDPRVGYVNFWGDTDGVVRRAHYRTTVDQADGRLPSPDSEVFHSLAGRALLRIGREDLIPNEPRCIRFTTSFKPYPLWEIFNQKTWEAPPYSNGEFFRGKVILVGPEGSLHKDYVRTALGNTPGPELHLQALNAALNKDFVHEPSPMTTLLSILGAGIVAWMLSAFITQPLLRFAVLVLGSAAFFFAAYILFGLKSGAVLLSVPPPLLAANISGLVWLTCEQVLDRIEKNRTRRTLERYVSKDLVKEILDNPASLLTTLGGVRKSVAILFTDLRGFTTMTEEADSVQLVTQLNEYFTAMVKRIFDNKGTPDKFIGDAIMATWGIVHTEGPAKDVERAVTASFEMQAALRELNANWEKRGIRPFHMGIGINYGSVIAGNIGATGGASEKMDLTAIGDPVNLASRLEGTTKEYGLDLLLGEGAAEHVKDLFHLQLVDLVQVKGKTKPISVYTVLSPKRESLASNLSDYLTYYGEGMKHYRAGTFTPAIASFESALKADPETHSPRCSSNAAASWPPIHRGLFGMAYS
ncbi:MAG: adenylate/guanylate cyclase domain-containing protein [Verrucomicrobiales bacterium]